MGLRLPKATDPDKWGQTQELRVASSTLTRVPHSASHAFPVPLLSGSQQKTTSGAFRSVPCLSIGSDFGIIDTKTEKGNAKNSYVVLIGCSRCQSEVFVTRPPHLRSSSFRVTGERASERASKQPSACVLGLRTLTRRSEQAEEKWG